MVCPILTQRMVAILSGSSKITQNGRSMIETIVMDSGPHGKKNISLNLTITICTGNRLNSQ